MNLSSYGHEWIKLDPDLEGETDEGTTSNFRYNFDFKKPVRALAIRMQVEDQSSTAQQIELTVNGVATTDYYSTELDTATPGLSNRDGKDHVRVALLQADQYVSGWVFILGGDYVVEPGVNRPSFMGSLSTPGRQNTLLRGYLTSGESKISQYDLHSTADATGFAEIYGLIP